MNKTTYIILISLFLSFSLYSQESKKDSEALIQKGIEAFSAKNYSLALEYYNEAFILSKKHDWIKEMWIAKHNSGMVYGEASNNGEALKQYREALEVLEGHKEFGEQKVITLMHIGNIHSTEKEYKEGIKYFERAHNMAKKEASAKIIKVTALSLANNYNTIKHNLNEAGKILQEVKKPVGNVAYDNGWYIVYSENLLLRNNVSGAKKIVDSLLPIVLERKEESCFYCIVTISAMIFKKTGEYDKGINYLKIGLNEPLEVNKRITLLEQLSEFYRLKNDYKRASVYNDSIIIYKDSLLNIVNHELYETNKVKLKIKDYQNDLKINEKKIEAERTFFVVLIIFGFILVILIYRSYKLKEIRQKQERIIAENNEKINNLEFDNLNNDIAEKNRKLFAKALYMSGRDELIKDATESLLKIQEIKKNPELLKYIESLEKELNTEDKWGEFMAYFEEVNPEFLSAIKEKHPNLSSNDIRFICYIYMNINIKEISTILNISYDACRIRKQRISEKMGFDKDVSLYDYVRNINKPNGDN